MFINLKYFLTDKPLTHKKLNTYKWHEKKLKYNNFFLHSINIGIHCDVLLIILIYKSCIQTYVLIINHKHLTNVGNFICIQSLSYSRIRYKNIESNFGYTRVVSKIQDVFFTRISCWVYQEQFEYAKKVYSNCFPSLILLRSIISIQYHIDLANYIDIIFKFYFQNHAMN